MTNDCKHTPGPWKAVRYSNGWHIGPQPDGVCSITDNSDGSMINEHEENARLIASAPNLLRRLINLVNSVKNDAYYMSSYELVMAKEAVAEALGDERNLRTQGEISDDT